MSWQLACLPSQGARLSDHPTEGWRLHLRNFAQPFEGNILAVGSHRLGSRVLWVLFGTKGDHRGEARYILLEGWEV